MFKLGEEQQQAIDLIKDFLNSDKQVFTLTGFAGTGKSTIIKEICDYLDNESESYINYVLCAPTHAAKVVMENFSGREAITLHKLLALSPNLEIFELDFNYLMFVVGDKASLFPYDGVVICDEASMVNDYLFDLITLKAKQFMSKIIFVGDKAQLRPVNAITHSKVFSVSDMFTLKYIYRQSNESGLSAVLPTLRHKSISHFTNHIGTEGSVLCYTDTLNFFREAVPIFKKAIKESNILETKFLAYTNARVNAFNKKMQQILFQNENEYNKFEFITGFENFEYGNGKFWNSMDYIIIDPPRKVDMQIPFFIKLPGYILNLYDSSQKTSSEVFILSRNDISEDYYISLASIIENIRLDAVELKNRRSPAAKYKWQDYYKVMKSFATPKDLYFDNRLIRKKSLDYGYAITTHKSQGRSINNVFIDMKDISICRDREEFRQLQYVSVSRAKINAHILQ